MSSPRTATALVFPSGTRILLVTLFLGLGWGGEVRGQDSPPPLSTFSIVACDPVSGFLGVGIQSRVVAAGAIVPAAAAGVGAIASQAAANVGYKAEALQLLAEGRTPAEIRDHFVATDPGIQRRQFAIVDAQCNFATFTGDSTSAWTGHRVGANYSVQGNILAGEQVLESMADAFETAQRQGRPFGERILQALKAGQAAGGDARGQQGAGLLVVKEGGGYGGGDDRYADLRVEDHVAPILELERVYGIWMSVFHPDDHFLPMGPNAPSVTAGAHVCRLRELLELAGHPAGSWQGGCVMDEGTLRGLRSFQEAEGLPVTPSLSTQAALLLRERAGR